MVKYPTAVGLTLCHQVVVEEGTRNFTLVNTFHRMVVRDFDEPVERFFVVLLITDGLGSGTLKLQITPVDDTTIVYNHSWRIDLSDALRQYQIRVGIAECRFPGPRQYDVAVLIDRVDCVGTADGKPYRKVKHGESR